MFIKASTFKRMVKNAYQKYGIHIQRDRDALALSGSYWHMWFLYSQIPKEFMGALIEVTGYIPDVNDEVICSEGEGIQYETGFSQLDLMQRAKDAAIKVHPSNIILCGISKNHRVMVAENGEVGTVYEDVWQSITGSTIDKDAGHTGLEGPKCYRGSYRYFWHNNVMALSVLTNEPGEGLKKDFEAIKDYLSGSDEE